MNEIRLHRHGAAELPGELAPPGTPTHVAVEPGLLDQDHVVIRADDDTDEDYQGKQRLLVAVLAVVRNA